MGGGSDVKYPAPSAQELALQQEQLDILRANEAYNKETRPFVESALGYTRDETGKLREMTEEERYASLRASEQQAYNISKLASEREMKALRGELEIDPATERSLAEEQERLRQKMYTQIGPGWETSSAGIESLGEQQQRTAAIRDAVRRGEMTTSEQLAQSREGQLQEALVNELTSSREPMSRGASIASSYQQPLEWYGQQRANQFASKQAAAQQQAAKMQGISSGFGSALSCCFIICAADPTNEMLDAVRTYRDSHFEIDSDVAHGYKRLALWLVPPMRKYPLVKKLVRFLMVSPMEQYAKADYDKNVMKKAALYPIALFWGVLFGTLGLFYGERNWIKYWRLSEHF